LLQLLSTAILPKHNAFQPPVVGQIGGSKCCSSSNIAVATLVLAVVAVAAAAPTKVGR
jgi:hypothetical protein